MLNIERSRIVFSKSATLDDDASVTDEGMVLILTNDDGKPTVTESSAAAGTFYGVSLFERRAPATLPAVRLIPGDGELQTATLDNYVNGSASLRVINNATGVEAALDPASAQTEAAIAQATGVITISSALLATETLKVTYRYTPTVQQLIPLVGTVINASELDAGADVGVVQKGVIYTSNFVTSEAWAVGDQLRLGASGQFAKTGAGTQLTTERAVVVETPTTAQPFLGIELF